MLTAGGESTSAAMIVAWLPWKQLIINPLKAKIFNPFTAILFWREKSKGMATGDYMETDEGPVRHLLSYESIKMMGESVGVANLNEDAATTLAEDVEYRLKEIVQDAMKFMRHSKRKRMKCSDLDCALRAKNVEPLYGFDSAEHHPFKHTMGGNKEYFYPDDKELELADLINAPLPRLPVDTTLRSHWLAVEGVQPAIPENPAACTIEEQQKEAQGDTGVRLGDLPAHTREIRFDKKGKKSSKEETPSSTEWSKLKPLQAHALSLEQQLYYKEISDACVGISDSKRQEALSSLASDPGLYQLLPQFSSYITEGIKVNMSQRKLQVLKYLLKMVKSLLDNPTLSLERCLHELLPPILSCLINRQVCLRPEAEDHWFLRDQAAKILAEICRKYSNSTNRIQSRITRVLLQALNNNTQGLAVHYGAVAALIELGQECITTLLLPRLKKESQYIDATPPAKTYEHLAATKLTQLIQRHIAPVLLLTQPNLDTVQAFQENYGSLGTSLFNQVKTLKQTRAGLPSQGMVVRLQSPTLKSPTVTVSSQARGRPPPLSITSPHVSAVKISGRTTPKAQSPIAALSSPTIAAALRLVQSSSPQSGTPTSSTSASTPISVSLLSAVMSNPAIASQLQSALAQQSSTTVSSSQQDSTAKTTPTTSSNA